MRITEWCAVSTGLGMEVNGCATPESPEAVLSPLVSAINRLREAGAHGAEDAAGESGGNAAPFVAALADTAIQACVLCGRLGPDVPGEVERLVTDSRLLFGEPEFTVTWATLPEILLDEVGYTGLLLQGELTRREDPEEVQCLLAYLLLSLFRIADQLGVDLSAAIDRKLTPLLTTQRAALC